MLKLAEMLTDLLQNIYKRIAQLGQAIQGLKLPGGMRVGPGKTQGKRIHEQDEAITSQVKQDTTWDKNQQPPCCRQHGHLVQGKNTQ